MAAQRQRQPGDPGQPLELWFQVGGVGSRAIRGEALFGHRRSLAQALHTRFRRHIAEGNSDEARTTAREAIEAYRQIAATPGADVSGVASGLTVLSRELGAAGLQAESTAAAQAAADVQN
jgi:hypothetical protein